MALLATSRLVLNAVFALIGLCVGSFLNVLALRSLEQRSILWPPSACPHCQHRLSILENIPLLSFLCLKGRCRWCQEPISGQYPLVEGLTALSFLLLINVFGLSWYAVGMMVLVSTLIAVTITDVKEKLIPHDITYPSILAGLAFSALIRRDLAGAMIGVGGSYILFDFLAHYGLKLYLSLHGNTAQTGSAVAVVDDEVDQELGLLSAQSREEVEEIEVMGGGDAVLSAVIAAWLGWQRLIVALAVGFVVGTLVGCVLLVIEMRRANILSQCLKPALWSSLFGFVLFAVMPMILMRALGLESFWFPWLILGVAGAVAGLLSGVVFVGTRVSKPFPFGPALAAGAVCAMFIDPVSRLVSGGA